MHDFFKLGGISYCMYYTYSLTYCAQFSTPSFTRGTRLNLKKRRFATNGENLPNTTTASKAKI